MANKIIKCPDCGKEAAYITYEENRLYRLKCILCGADFFTTDSSYANAVKVFEEIEPLESGVNNND